MLAFTPLPILFSLYVDIQCYFSIPKSSSQSTSHVTPSFFPFSIAFYHFLSHFLGFILLPSIVLGHSRIPLASARSFLATLSVKVVYTPSATRLRLVTL